MRLWRLRKWGPYSKDRYVLTGLFPGDVLDVESFDRSMDMMGRVGVRNWCFDTFIRSMVCKWERCIRRVRVFHRVQGAFLSVAGTFFKAFGSVAPFSCSFVEVIYPGYH